ncbi:MAG: SMP-30/gluconolactonase/LRE family protein [Cytophagales bacterium]|nr:MAG: SMP-30/gluconolactonase/LRE family protein [Cytophagales bacterium]
MQIKEIVKANNILGESPLWFEESKTLYWIDIFDKKIFRLDTSSNQTEIWNLEVMPTAICKKNSNTLYVVFESGVGLFDLKTASFTVLDTINLPENIRFNDAACDANGKLWLGTMDKQCEAPIGKLYGLELEKISFSGIENIIESNGIAWSNDNTIMYFVDSMNYVIHYYKYDLALGRIIEELNSTHLPKDLGVPDGIKIDKNGLLWVAMWGGAKLLVVNTKTHGIEKQIELPSLNCTSLTFINSSYSKMYVTTANYGTTDAENQKYPNNGSLLMVRL